MAQKPEGQRTYERMIFRSYSDVFGFSKPIPTQEEERIQLPDTLTGIGPNDVLCGRGKESFNHVGNKRFREIITNSLQDYTSAETRSEKSLVVLSIFDGIRTRGGRFLKKDEAQGRWYELSDQQTKEKIAHAVRDAVNSNESRRIAKKTPPKKTEIQQHEGENRFTHKSEQLSMDIDSSCNQSCASPSSLQSRQVYSSGRHDSFHSKTFYQNLDAMTNRESVSPRRLNAGANTGFFPFGAFSHPFGGDLTQNRSVLSSSTEQAGDSVTRNEIATNSHGIFIGNSGPEALQTSHMNNFDDGQHALVSNDRIDLSFSRGSSGFNFVGTEESRSAIDVSTDPLSLLEQEEPDSDPFLDQINEVLGPLGQDDRNAVFLSQPHDEHDGVYGNK